MIVVTGHSHKLDGVCFVADTDDHDKACEMMRDAWNAQFSDQMQLVVAVSGTFLLHADVDLECVKDFEDECPRREGFALYTNQYEPGSIIQRMPW